MNHGNNSREREVLFCGGVVVVVVVSALDAFANSMRLFSIGFFTVMAGVL
jgi:hypothetical protein